MPEALVRPSGLLDWTRLGPSNRRMVRRHRVQLFDEHAPVVLAFANLLLGDPLSALDVARVVLLREIPRTAPGVPTWMTRRAYALAVLAECEDGNWASNAVDAPLAAHSPYANVGLAIYGGVSYRQIAQHRHHSDSESLELLRAGLRALAHPDQIATRRANAMEVAGPPGDGDQPGDWH